MSEGGELGAVGDRHPGHGFPLGALDCERRAAGVAGAGDAFGTSGGWREAGTPFQQHGQEDAGEDVE